MYNMYMYDIYYVVCACRYSVHVHCILPTTSIVLHVCIVYRPEGKISWKKFHEWPCCPVGRLGNANFCEKNFADAIQFMKIATILLCEKFTLYGMLYCACTCTIK